MVIDLILLRNNRFIISSGINKRIQIYDIQNDSKVINKKGIVRKICQLVFIQIFI